MEEHKAWVVAVDMGYGHQRAAYPLRHLSPTGKVLIANNYAGIPHHDFRVWNDGRRTYEFFSQASNWPIVGGAIFSALDSLQKIAPFYPFRDLSAPTIQVRQTYGLIHRGLGRDLIEQLNKENIPLITTFFTVAFAAEEHKFKNEIYVVICDSDISRAWVAENPQKSRIKYLAPCRRVVERLKMYGVKEHNIFLTGFPLPQENLGDEHFKTLKSDLLERIINLDPEKRFRTRFADTIRKYLGDPRLEERHSHPLTLTFAVGGAGAQRTIAKQILLSLREKIQKEEINLNLVAGSRNDVYSFFKRAIINAHLVKNFGRNLNIIYAAHKEDYFKTFNETLRTTDVLWTKPSELVFYSALGLPIIMAPSLGSQEDYNRTWLKTVQGGISGNDPRYTHEWLFDWVKYGWLANTAMSGFLDGRQFGVQNIVDVVFKGMKDPSLDDSLF
jgi:hypothetical protein